MPLLLLCIMVMPTLLIRLLLRLRYQFLCIVTTLFGCCTRQGGRETQLFGQFATRRNRGRFVGQ